MSLAGEKGQGAGTPLLAHSCFCPGDQSVLALLGDAGRSLWFLGRDAIALWRGKKKKNQSSTQCPFSSVETSTMLFSRSESQLCLPASAMPGSQPPSSSCHWVGWGSSFHSCNPPLSQSCVCALSPRELLKPNSSDSTSPRLAVCQPASWAVASGVCFSEMQSS